MLESPHALLLASVLGASCVLGVGCRSAPRIDPAQAESEARRKIDRVSWLIGTWRSSRPDGYTREVWSPATIGGEVGTVEFLYER